MADQRSIIRESVTPESRTTSVKRHLSLMVALLTSLTALLAQASSAPPRPDAKQNSRRSNDPAGEQASSAYGFTAAQGESLREPFRQGIDPRDFANGLLIPGEGYCDQPYVVVTKDGGWLCTISDPARFYSHRRDQRTGRMASVIVRS